MTRPMSGFRAAVSAAFLTAIDAVGMAQDYGPAPAPPPPTPATPAPKAPGEPVFADMKLQDGAGLASNGLRLTLSADKVALSERLGAIGQPVLLQPTVLHLLFRNVSESPIVFDAYNLSLSRLSLVVVGPDKQSVAIARRPFDFKTRNSLPIDFPQIEPGNPFVTMEKLQFPGDFNALVNVSLFKPGEYKLQVVYSRPATGLGRTWSGVVVSNTVAFRVEGPPAPEPPKKAAPATTSDAPPKPPPPPPPPAAPAS